MNTKDCFGFNNVDRDLPQCFPNYRSNAVAKQKFGRLPTNVTADVEKAFEWQGSQWTFHHWGQDDVYLLDGRCAAIVIEG